MVRCGGRRSYSLQKRPREKALWIRDDVMYLHLGQSVVVPHKDILGIFDLDNASWAFKTREFLERAELEGRVVPVGDDLPRSFVLVGGQDRAPTVYISQLSPAALLGRAERNSFE